MKRITVIVFSVLIGFFLLSTGCSESNTSNDTETEVFSQESSSEVNSHFTYLGKEYQQFFILNYWVDNQTDIVYVSQTSSSGGSKSSLTPLVYNYSGDAARYITRSEFEEYNKEHGIALTY